jgi:nucleoside 2-deoxyribosyltransferase
MNKKPKVYLAGPDIFLPNPMDHGEKLKTICSKYNLEGLYPLDNQLDLSDIKRGPQKAIEIYKADIELINESDCLVANLTPFRGPSADPGTCFELGYAIAQKKPVAIYSFDTKEYKQKLKDMSFMEDQWSIEDMGLSDNLMLIAPTNNIIYESFEEAIKNLSKIMN